MIQANELRIGNLVEKSIKSGQGRTLICKIGCEDIVRVFENIGSFNYNPIPLTEEWLKKLGFVYDDMSDTDDDNTWYHLDIGTVKFHSDKSCNFESVYCGVNMTKLEFKNVHKFQNFVFDLTGKELEFKL